MSLLSSHLLVAVLVTLSARVASAQPRLTRVTFTASPGFVNFDGFGGHFGAAVAQLGLSREATSHLGAELSALVVAPMGSASIMPTCTIPDGPCQSRSTPSMLTGVLLSPFVLIGQSGLRASASVGGVWAVGGEGFSDRSTLAAGMGIAWLHGARSRFAPVISVRAVRLSPAVAGARYLVLPGIGLAF